jgi:hypothetical protein
MDIQIFEQGALKIKVKKTTLAVNPKSPMQKFDADAIVLMDKSSDISRINNFRVVIDAPGEYEVSGLKISGVKTEDNNNIMFVLTSGMVAALIAKASYLEKASAEKIGEYEILIIDADSDLNQTLITAMEPKVVILYGAKAKEGAKALGKDAAPVSSKIALAEDKLPEEMGVQILA